jgi:tripartite tricarboxylate transporter TctB family protein
VILRRDHVAGGAFVIAGAVLYAISGDLPFGTLSMPGAGMMPKLAIGMMMLFGLILVLRAGESPPLATIDWRDLGHAARVVVVAAAATALYTAAGFLVTMILLIFVLLALVERKNVLRAAAVSIGVVVIAYLVFGTFLKSPLPQGILWF